jgi:hypothetical protein
VDFDIFITKKKCTPLASFKSAITPPPPFNALFSADRAFIVDRQQKKFILVFCAKVDTNTYQRCVRRFSQPKLQSWKPLLMPSRARLTSSGAPGTRKQRVRRFMTKNHQEYLEVSKHFFLLYLRLSAHFARIFLSNGGGNFCIVAYYCSPFMLYSMQYPKWNFSW